MCGGIVTGEDWCHSDEVYEAPYCPGYTPPSPTPTPSPSPSPTCDPATKPNNTNCYCDTNPISGSPQWSCLCSYTDSLGIPNLGIPANYLQNPGPQGSGGCPGFSVNNGGDCCICTLSSSDCPEGTHLDNQVCNCIANTGGDDGSGGGGGSDPPPVEYTRECIDFVWVHFVSYDGGNSWHYDDRESYGGCFYID